MTNYTLKLFGSFEVRFDDLLVAQFRSDKARALLAYLALEPQQHARTSLAALLWPNIGEKYAKINLRNTLHRLRQALDRAAPGAADQLLTVTRTSIQFNIDSAYVDVNHFLTLLTAKDDLTLRNQLNEAAMLYEGELLAGFGIADAPAFEEWLLLRREMLQQRALMAFRSLADSYETVGNYEQAYDLAKRRLSLAPYVEDSYRQLMRLLAKSGQPERSLQLLEEMRTLFRTELDAEPSEQTITLANEIVSGGYDKVTGWPDEKATRWQDDKMSGSSSHSSANVVIGDASSSPHPVTQSPPLDLRDVPDLGPFFGRITERQQIAQWLLVDRCRIVAILGIGGMGKTSLAAQSIRELAVEAKGQFDAVLWRSLLNAPPLAELLPPLLQTLSNQQLSTLPENLDDQLRLLLGYLRTKRVLLVLDNMESILEPERAGAYRAGYEQYSQLIQQMATLEHQSHLLLTSRERPSGYERLERDSSLVQSLQLAGLDDVAGHELLNQRGLYSTSAEEAMLVERYSGNPLALKIVADTVDELYAGDLNEFLADDSTIFDGIRLVLDQHFARLTDLEQQILFWLAVEREPCSSQMLRQNMLHPPRNRILLEALRSLQRRSLVDVQASNFTLQNVVTEYVTERLIEAAIEEVETGKLDRLLHQALFVAQAKEYIRQSQARLILNPIGEHLVGKHGSEKVQMRIKQILVDLRIKMPQTKHYAGGNLLNLLLTIGADLTGHDFSHLPIWQVNLQNVMLQNVNFLGADFTNTLFVDNFDALLSLAMHPSKALLASSAVGDALIRLWSLIDGHLIATLAGHDQVCSSLAFHPEGHLLASGSRDQTIHFWDVETHRSLHTVHTPHGNILQIVFSPDGTLLASSCNTQLVCLWSVPTGKLLTTLPPHGQIVEGLAFHPNGKMLATSNQKNISFWNVERLYTDNLHTEKAGVRQSISEATSSDSDYDSADLSADLIASLQGDDQNVIHLDFSPDGSLLASGSIDTTVSLWEVETLERLHHLKGHQDYVNAVSFTPDGQYLVSASSDSTVRLWDVTSGETVDILHGHSGGIRQTSVSEDGKILASAGIDGVIHVWELDTPGERRIIRTFRGSLGRLTQLSFSTEGILPDGVLLAGSSAKGWCHIWHLAWPPQWYNNAAIPYINIHAQKGFVPHLSEQRWDKTFLEDYTQTAETDDEHETSQVSLQISYQFALKGHKGVLNSVAFRPNTAHVATSGRDRTVRIWDAASGKSLIVLHQHRANVFRLAYNHQGTILASGDHHGNIYLWRIDHRGNYQLWHTMRASEQIVLSLEFSPDGQILASSTADLTVQLWDVERGTCLQVVDTLSESARAVTFDPQGERLVAALANGEILVWTLADGKLGPLKQTFHHDQAPINAVAFDDSGWLLVSGGMHPKLRIWDTISGQELPALEGLISQAVSIAYWPSNNIIAVAGDEGIIQLCDIASGTLLHTLEVQGPYAGMNITGVTGISDAQREALKALGAVEK
ncbi:MAG: BTAD domain-containing putative transcriptional regulator [Chloroflexota bacterium]